MVAPSKPVRAEWDDWLKAGVTAGYYKHISASKKENRPYARWYYWNVDDNSWKQAGSAFLRDTLAKYVRRVAPPPPPLIPSPHPRARHAEPRLRGLPLPRTPTRWRRPRTTSPASPFLRRPPTRPRPPRSSG